MKRSEIIAEARTYLLPKSRWAHRGRTREGIDCIGFIIMLADHFGVPYEDRDDYGRNAQGETFLNHMKKYLPLGTYPLKKGQIVVIRDDFLPCHTGFIDVRGGKTFILHSSIGGRGVIEDNWSREFQSRLRCVLEFPGVEED